MARWARVARQHNIVILTAVGTAIPQSDESHDNMQAIADLVDDGGVVFINDKKLLGPLRVKLHFADRNNMQH